MRVFELMAQLQNLPAGAEVRVCGNGNTESNPYGPVICLDVDGNDSEALISVIFYDESEC